jgi:superfamily II DNA or RNA helicase
MDALQHLLTTARIEPRSYQSRIVSKVIDLFSNKQLRSILIESPTGSGKTVMGLMVATAMQQALGLKVGWVAMRRYLLSQAEAEATERGLNLKANYISMFEKNPPENLDLLIVDEAQHDAAGSMAHLHNVIRPKYILGLSATPFRADKVKLCFDSVIRDAGIRTLIEDGYLSRFTHYTIPSYTPQAVATQYLNDRPRWGKTVMYFHTIQQCEEAAALLQAGGVRVEIITAQGDRDAQLQRFEDGDTDVLVNCIVLAEGFDCPSLQTVFCRPSEKGITVQMCGRVLRKHAGTPVKNIVQCQKTRWPFIRTAGAAGQYVWTDGDWRSLSVNPRIQQVAFNTMVNLARNPVELPEYLKKIAPVSRRRDRAAREAH